MILLLLAVILFAIAAGTAVLLDNPKALNFAVSLLCVGLLLIAVTHWAWR